MKDVGALKLFYSIFQQIILKPHEESTYSDILEEAIEVCANSGVDISFTFNQENYYIKYIDLLNQCKKV